MAYKYYNYRSSSSPSLKRPSTLYKAATANFVVPPTLEEQPKPIVKPSSDFAYTSLEGKTKYALGPNLNKLKKLGTRLKTQGITKNYSM